MIQQFMNFESDFFLRYKINKYIKRYNWGQLGKFSCRLRWYYGIIVSLLRCDSGFVVM